MRQEVHASEFQDWSLGSQCQSPGPVPVHSWGSLQFHEELAQAPRGHKGYWSSGADSAWGLVTLLLFFICEMRERSQTTP